MYLGSDVRATMRRRLVVWTLGRAEARLDATRPDWWLTITSSTGGAFGISTHSDRHDRFTAEITAANIIIHFDSRFCRGLDVDRYTEHELAMMNGGK
jgi:hypothetical protein